MIHRVLTAVTAPVEASGNQSSPPEGGATQKNGSAPKAGTPRDETEKAIPRESGTEAQIHIAYDGLSPLAQGGRCGSGPRITFYRPDGRKAGFDSRPGRSTHERRGPGADTPGPLFGPFPPSTRSSTHEDHRCWSYGRYG